MKINSSEIILITGLNGSGKTTFCRLLTGLIPQYQGSVILDGKELHLYKPSQIAEKVLYLKQEGNLNIVAATPLEDLEIRQHKFSKHDDSSSTKQREEALKMVVLYNQKKTPIWELSAGQIKRAGLASLPLFPFHYWILDEPFLGLDSDSISIVMHWLSERKKQGLGALITNHLGNLDKSVYHLQYHIENGEMMKV